MLALAGAASASACADRRGAPPAAADAPPASVASGPAAAPSAAARDARDGRDGRAGAVDAEGVVTVVTDRAALAVVARAGGSLGAVLDPEAPSADDLGTLAARPAWGSVARVLASDVAEVAARDPLAGTSVARHAHRLFDAKWLRAPAARLELVGLTQRLDRRAFTDGACGEVRLVYRLAYGAEPGRRSDPSRLPMTVALELRGPDRARDPGCHGAAQRWIAPRGPDGAPLVGEALGRWLVGPTGPLADGALARARLAQLVVNLQRVRWPSAVRPDLGGHAEYVLRAFDGPAPGAPLAPRRLEGTPDVDALRAAPARRAALLAWLRRPENVAAALEGTARLPDDALATRALSVTPGGLARRANRPFARLFAARDLDGVDAPAGRAAPSGEAMLRRLDDLSCTGCHASRSVAGFHLLGESAPDEPAAGALAVPFSAHVRDERRRRRAFTIALARGDAGDDARPLATGETPGAGASPGPAAASASRDGAPRGVGEACEPATIDADPDPHRDRARRLPAPPCGPGLACERTAVGFPSGMCSGGCDALPAGARCGAIAVLEPFNACLARREPFARCAALHTRPAALAACDERTPCRDDYVCAGRPGEGACLPPYFVRELRVDGHPAP